MGSHQGRKEAPPPRGGSWTGDTPRRAADPREDGGVTVRARQEQGRELAIRVQDELGTDGWEVLYRLGDRMVRVDPPGSWPAGTWQQELLGYAPRDRHDASPGRG